MTCGLTTQKIKKFVVEKNPGNLTQCQKQASLKKSGCQSFYQETENSATHNEALVEWGYLSGVNKIGLELLHVLILVYQLRMIQTSLNLFVKFVSQLYLFKWFG